MSAETPQTKETPTTTDEVSTATTGSEEKETLTTPETKDDAPTASPGSDGQETVTKPDAKDDGHTQIEVGTNDAAPPVTPTREASEVSVFQKVMKRIFIGPTTDEDGKEIDYEKDFYRRRCALWLFGLFNLLCGLAMIIIAAYTKEHYAGLCGSTQYLSISAGIILGAGALVFLAVRCFQRRATCFYGTLVISVILVAWALVFLAPILFLRPYMVSDHELELTLTLVDKQELIPQLIELAGDSSRPAAGSEDWDNTAVIIGLVICGVSLILAGMVFFCLIPSVMTKYLLWYAPLIAGLFFCVVTWVYLGDGGKVGASVGTAIATFFALIFALMCHTKKKDEKACAGCARLDYDVLMTNARTHDHWDDDCPCAFIVPIVLGVPLAIVMLSNYIGEAPTFEKLKNSDFPDIYDWGTKIDSSVLWFDTHQWGLVTEGLSVGNLTGKTRATQLYAMQLVQNGNILKFYVMASFICCAFYAIIIVVRVVLIICGRAARGGNACPKCGERFGKDTPSTCSNCGIGLKWKD